ncbi:uncharacterized protein LOC124151028 [Haliotis rufescens]|uniref:uncharacterized protein LOC124151028 n=1 Tax=Haliotis rufescens TaxID=6454 RepID=UPI00201F8E7C|nr:uncharacterized protein LOC124151028 [Haliotis rufescens]
MSFLRSLLVTCMVTASTCRLPFDWCSSPQWEALQGTLRGVFKDDIPHMEASNLKISYDLNHSKIATTQLQDGDSPEVKKIYDYTQKTLYVIENNACRRVLLNETFRKACIPREFVCLFKESGCVIANLTVKTCVSFNRARIS